MTKNASIESIHFTLAAFPHLDIKPEHDVYIIRPAIWLSRHRVHQTIPGHETTQWTKDPSPMGGWILQNVAEIVDTSVSKECSDMLLTETGQYAIASYTSNWATAEDGLLIPEGSLSKLRETSPIDLGRLQESLDRLIA